MKVHQILLLLTWVFRLTCACEEPTVYAFPAECPEEDLFINVASNSTGFLLSSNDSSYVSDLTCTIVLTPPAQYSVALYLDKIDLRPNCQDRLTVCLPDNEEVEYCEIGSDAENITVFFSDEVKIIFRSGPGSTAGYTGFEFVFTSIEEIQYGGGNKGSAIRKIAPKFKPKITTKVTWKPRPRIITIPRTKIGTVNTSGSSAGNTVGLVVFCTIVAILILFGLFKLYKYVKEDETWLMQTSAATHHIPPPDLQAPSQELQTPQEQAYSSDLPPPYNKCIPKKPTAPPPPYSMCVPPENSVSQHSNALEHEQQYNTCNETTTNKY